MQPMQRLQIRPNSAQLGGIPYHSPCRHAAVESQTETHRHTDARDHNTFRVVYDTREM